MTKIIAFKVSDDEHKRIWKEATKVPGRTISDWARPIVLGSLPERKVKAPRLPQRSDN